MHRIIIINPTIAAAAMPITDLDIVLLEVEEVVELRKANFLKLAEAVLEILALLLKKVVLRGAGVVAGTTIML